VGWTGRRGLTAVAAKMTGSVLRLIPVLTRLIALLALLAMVGMAIATPKAWATKVSGYLTNPCAPPAGIDASEGFSRLGFIPATCKIAQLQ